MDCDKKIDPMTETSQMQETRLLRSMKKELLENNFSLMREVASLKRKVAELESRLMSEEEGAEITGERMESKCRDYESQIAELRKTNDKLCRQLKERELEISSLKEFIDARVRRDEVKGKLASRVIGTPKADDIEKALGGEDKLDLSTEGLWRIALEMNKNRPPAPILRGTDEWARKIAREEANQFFRGLLLNGFEFEGKRYLLATTDSVPSEPER